MNTHIKFLIMDVDGTLTDGKIYMGNNGEVMKVFSIKDGYGIHDILIPSGIRPIIITGRKSKILENRCTEIGIEDIYQGVSNKIEMLLSITHDLNSVAYIGDDNNDFLAMKLIKDSGGMIGCPMDATPRIKELSHFISQKNGGDGAVREFIEWLCIDEDVFTGK